MRRRTTGRETVIKTRDAEGLVTYAVRVDAIDSVRSTMDEDGDPCAIVSSRSGVQDLLTFASLVDRDRFVRSATQLMAIHARRSRSLSRN